MNRNYIRENYFFIIFFLRKINKIHQIYCFIKKKKKEKINIFKYPYEYLLKQNLNFSNIL